MASFTVRDATDDDAAACAAIYAPYVSETAITFETEAPSVDELRRRIRNAQRSHAWLVLEAPLGDDDARQLCGYAYAGPFATRSAYRWATEVSIYLDRSWHGAGGGRALYASLLPRLRERGFQIATACMTLPNAASVGLHRSFGFETVAGFADIGWKHGAWHSTTWMQLRLAPADGAPPPLA